jgi:hypothetical protein
MANDKDYGSQSREQGNRPNRGDKRGRENDDRTQRDPNEEMDSDRDLGSRDRGVERSDWNYSKPGTSKKQKGSNDDLESDDNM